MRPVIPDVRLAMALNILSDWLGGTYRFPSPSVIRKCKSVIGWSGCVLEVMPFSGGQGDVATHRIQLRVGSPKSKHTPVDFLELSLGNSPMNV